MWEVRECSCVFIIHEKPIISGNTVTDITFEIPDEAEEAPDTQNNKEGLIDWDPVKDTFDDYEAFVDYLLTSNINFREVNNARDNYQLLGQLSAMPCPG